MELNSDTFLLQRPKAHFKFLNGDQYYGEYGVNFEEKKVYRHGCGTYVTAKCCIFKGKWEHDRLVGCGTIKYPNKNIYSGCVDKNGNYIKGTYKFEDCSKLAGTFNDIPFIEFQDVNETFWKADMADDSIILTNRNVA